MPPRRVEEGVEAPAEAAASAGAAPIVTTPPTSAVDLPDIPVPATTVAPPPTTVDAATAIVGDERFLPIAEPVLLAPSKPGPMRIFAPTGTPVHVIEAGRVAEIDEHIAGEVTIRADGDRFYRYRRLLPSSVCVSAGDHVAPGAIIGTIGEAIDDDPPCLVIGLQPGDGSWSDIYGELVGLPDPGELGLCIQAANQEWIDPLAGDRATEADRSDTTDKAASDTDIAALLSSRSRRP